MDQNMSYFSINSLNVKEIKSHLQGPGSSGWTLGCLELPVLPGLRLRQFFDWFGGFLVWLQAALLPPPTPVEASELWLRLLLG